MYCTSRPSACKRHRRRACGDYVDPQRNNQVEGQGTKMWK